ncbi:UBA-like_superfamily [Hexamita inflata]|uniref:UBA-like superfamily n=1 Tax=Hexamita inflata TaxID=28002 RepID=A0AA86R161_9EUKA|nr:UBA-like superfamily [Hexamita inflata]
MQVDIQYFMNVTNSSEQMAVYYLRQLQGNLEHAVEQYFEDNMAEKVEQFMMQTGSTKIRAEKQLTRNGKKQQPDTLQRAVNQQLDYLLRHGIQPKIQQNYQQNIQRQYDKINDFFSNFGQVKYAKQDKSIQPEIQVQKVEQVIQKPNEPEPVLQKLRIQTPILKEKYILNQNTDEQTEEELDEVQKECQDQIMCAYEFRQYESQTGYQNTQQSYNEQITDEVEEEEEYEYEQSNSDLQTQFQSQPQMYSFQPQGINRQYQNHTLSYNQQQNYKQYYNFRINYTPSTYNQLQQQIISNNKLFEQVINQVQPQNMLQASQTHSNLQQDEFQIFQISYDSILKQIEINNTMFAQLFGDQTQTQTQSKQPEPVQQNNDVAQTIIPKEPVKQNQVINDQMTTINKRSSSESVVLPDSESSSFTIDIESSEDQSTDYKLLANEQIALIQLENEKSCIEKQVFVQHFENEALNRLTLEQNTLNKQQNVQQGKQQLNSKNNEYKLENNLQINNSAPENNQNEEVLIYSQNEIGTKSEQNENNSNENAILNESETSQNEFNSNFLEESLQENLTEIELNDIQNPIE